MSRRHITFREVDKTTSSEAFLTEYKKRYQLITSKDVEKIFEEHHTFTAMQKQGDFLGEVLTTRFKKK
ncbi:hypothetical protein MFLO_13740 [Listeria floridensis FSL S10-1187]|uniref:Uncharacterized protein n=1 Tax=Listeria floridensis FSL S10-1187 TaxID=1265817 RepID=A0ABP3AUV4_9LIST|nr:hypothetical protein [Listeria floridensis]EUJ26938.1 hypothetical protein MFLO_13740 [Listeria floridensis FSL S10-1187]